MLSLGSLAFASPWLLAGLVVLPAIWLLIRITPPAPKRVIFPAIQFLFGLKPKEETPAHTPWWLLLLRLALAALLIIGLAHPLANPVARVPGNGALLIVIDDGWSSAHAWSQRIQAAVQLTEQAEREVRPVMLQTTAPLPGGEAPPPPVLRRASDIRSLIQALQPKPWPVDRIAALASLSKVPLKAPIQCVYLADGLADPAGQKGATDRLAEALQNLGSLGVETVAGTDLPYLLMPPERVPGDVTLTVKRAATASPAVVYLRAVAGDGRLLARLPASFDAGAATANAVLSLPVELRNALTRIDIEAQSQAASTLLFDDRWQRRPVGVVTGGAQAKDPSLLDSDFYLERALGPYAELRRGPIPTLLKNPPTLLLMDDTVQPSVDERNALNHFIAEGGVLVRFAGEHLAAERGDVADDLLPVRLRGGRTLGSALQWSEPAHLAPFDATSPFSGLAVPDDVTISRQVLAEPSIDLAEKSWARLSDGTPLVTAEHRGKGILVLFHIPASADWSNLPLSGLFVEMLRRSVLLGHGVEDAPDAAPQPPVETLDGFARLSTAATTATPLAKGGIVDARHPPGYYGNDTQRRALNLTSMVTEIAPIGALPSGVSFSQIGHTGETDLRPWFLGLALALLLIDLAIGLALRGLLPSRRAFAASLAIVIGLGMASPSIAQTAPPLPPPPPTGNPVVDFALKATLETRLAYVQTGVREIDDTSMAGLKGLTMVLNRRTAVEAAEPMAVDIEHDELAFFPLLYWPVSAQQPALSSSAIARVNFYLRNGGTILFDTRGEEQGNDQSLQHLVRGLEIPPLMQVPPDHVLTRAFYLLRDFPGRYDGGRLWVEAHENPNDEVSSVIVGANDFAGAWAVDNFGRGTFAAVPGGEGQREMAYRFGVNLVMYALTGNYKTDQVHVPAILERIGQ
jgi:hypothetical protein